MLRAVSSYGGQSANVLLRQGIDCATYGDSRLNGTYGSITDYGFSLENAVSPAGWISYLSRGRILFPLAYDFSVGGDTTTDMLARLSDVATCDAPMVLLLGGTNDRGSADMTAAQTIANLTTILARLKRAGKIVLLISEMPRGDATYTSYRLASPQLQYHAQVRDWMNNWVPANYPNTVVFDAYEGMAVYNSTTGDAITGMHYDGLHPSTIGAYTAALPIVEWANEVLPEPSVLPRSLSEPYDATYNPYGWLNSNPMFDGTSGTPGSGSSGNLATGWTGARNTAMAAGTIGPVLSKVARTNGTWQQMVFAGNTASNSSPQFGIYESIATPVTAGDVVEAVGEVEIDAGAVGIVGAYISLRFETGTTYENKALDKRDGTNALPSAALSGVQRTPKMIVPPGFTVARLRCVVDFAESYTGVSATVRFGCVGARKIRV